MFGNHSISTFFILFSKFSKKNRNKLYLVCYFHLTPMKINDKILELLQNRFSQFLEAENSKPARVPLSHTHKHSSTSSPNTNKNRTLTVMVENWGEQPTIKIALSPQFWTSATTRVATSWPITFVHIYKSPKLLLRSRTKVIDQLWLLVAHPNFQPQQTNIHPFFNWSSKNRLPLTCCLSPLLHLSHYLNSNLIDHLNNTQM